ncbi:hypothetical protein AB4Z30_28195 [Paenibacillus sp. 2TAF8]|jgi:hypothetical protein|uniref:hypothetical protein n=1 Tax=Paenibacillus sp. 2TAF8 TaxID=3233020 RepID=UPI003F98A657
MISRSSDHFLRRLFQAAVAAASERMPHVACHCCIAGIAAEGRPEDIGCFFGYWYEVGYNKYIVLYIEGFENGSNTRPYIVGLLGGVRSA